MAKVGDTLPDVTVHEGDPHGEVKIRDLFKGKKGILIGVPGAYTPGCSKTHLPGYVNDFDKLQAAGAEVIACVAVNDAFVMEAWGEANGTKGKVHMLADYKAELTKALGLDIDMSSKLGNVRSKRFSAVIEDNVIKTLNVEPDGTGLSCSLSVPILEQLKKV
jgi:2-Cys peroxiredoxin 5